MSYDSGVRAWVSSERRHWPFARNPGTCGTSWPVFRALGLVLGPIMLPCGTSLKHARLVTEVAMATKRTSLPKNHKICPVSVASFCMHLWNHVVDCAAVCLLVQSDMFSVHASDQTDATTSRESWLQAPGTSKPCSLLSNVQNSASSQGSQPPT